MDSQYFLMWRLFDQLRIYPNSDINFKNAQLVLKIKYHILMPPKKNLKAVKVQAKKQQKKSEPKSLPKTPAKSSPSSKNSKPATIVKSASKDIKPVVDLKASKSSAKGKKQTKKDPSPSSKDVGKRNNPVVKDDVKKTDEKAIKKTQSKEQLVKVVTKGGAAVDSIVPNNSAYRVLIDGGKVYSATLNQSNLDHNNNKFYIIQVLVNESTGAVSVWNRWGRVGVPGQNALKGPMDKVRAIADFNTKFKQKTMSGNYRQIQIKYEDEKEPPKEQIKKSKGPVKQVKSKMDESLQKLISLIFDVNIMNNTMKQIGYDAKRMPLGKLGDSTIKQAYGILSQLSQAIKNNQKDKFKSLSSQFYTLIPHDFGFKPMINFILDNQEKVKQKIKMLETISDMKITTKLLQQKSDQNESVFDQNYKKLGCSIQTVQTNSGEYKLLEEYFNNTKGYYEKVKIGQIYQVVRPNEFKTYNQKIGNNMLLWHGSRISNFVGILSQGLRIAPPQAPVSGYLFGKGIYLADMAEKSINYCRSGGSDHALILLIQGAVGNPNVLLQSNSQAKQLMEKAKKDSTKCHGSKAPPQKSYVNHKNVIVPKGKAMPTSSGSYMGHNEYIVYNMNQARIRYIMRMDMKGS